MNRNLAIRINREALVRLVGMMVARLGDPAGGALPRRACLAVLGMLRPVESALRRLLVILARDVVVTAPDERLRGGPVALRRGAKDGRRFVFALFDRRKVFGPRAPKHPPCLTVIDDRRRDAVHESRTVDTTAMRGRIEAVQRVLDDLPRATARMARWQARRVQRRQAGQPVSFVDPLRPGWPPGYRVRGREAVHEVLAETDRLARRAG